MPELLIDTCPLVLELSEGEQKGTIRFRGEFGRVDKPTANGRHYKEGLMRREIERLSEGMGRRRVLGELDHPSDGRTRLQRVSHVITKLDIDGPKVMGEAEPLDTPNGRILKALASAGVQVGVSSRGFGTTKRTAAGVEEVQDDFRLDTYDFVYEPADKTAYPDMYVEEKNKIPEDDMQLTLEDLRRDYPGLVEELSREAAAVALTEEQGNRDKVVQEAVAEAVTETEARVERRLKEKFSTDLRRHLEKLDEAATERARSEAMSDPEVAGALSVVEQIATIIAPFGVPADAQATIAEKEDRIAKLEADLAERELEVQAARKKTEEMESLAKKAAYTLHLERMLSDDAAETKEAVIGLVGDVMQFESKDALESRVESVRVELEAAKASVLPEEVPEDERKGFEERLAALESEIESAKERAEAAEEKAKEADERTVRALDAAEQAATVAYAEGIAANHPKGAQILSLCEGMKSPSEVDEVVRKLTEEDSKSQGRTLDEDEAERIRKRVAQGKERSLEEDTHGRRGNGKSNGAGAPKGIGLDEAEFDRLAGTRR